jgi:hypothetical protein
VRGGVIVCLHGCLAGLSWPCPLECSYREIKDNATRQGRRQRCDSEGRSC